MKKGLSKVVVKIATIILCNLHGVVFAAFYCSHNLLVSLTACRGTDQIGRSNLQGGAHWKLMMMSRFGRLVLRMVARARTIGDDGEEYSPFQLLITMDLDSWTLSFIYL